jgi:hypothetical protein
MQGIFRKLLVAGIILIAVPAFCQIVPKDEPPIPPDPCYVKHLKQYDWVYWNENTGWHHQAYALLMDAGSGCDVANLGFWDSSSVEEWYTSPYFLVCPSESPLVYLTVWDLGCLQPGGYHWYKVGCRDCHPLQGWHWRPTCTYQVPSGKGETSEDGEAYAQQIADQLGYELKYITKP